MKLRLLAVFIISTLLISCNHQSNEHRLDNTNVLSIPQNSTEEILNESNDSCLSPTNKQTNDDNSSFGINVFGDEGPIGYLLADGKDEHQLKVFLDYQSSNADSANASLRLYLLEDGKPINFSIDEKEWSEKNDIKIPYNEGTFVNLKFKTSDNFGCINLICMDGENQATNLTTVYPMFNKNSSVSYSEKYKKYMVKMEQNGVWGLGITDNKVDPKSEYQVSPYVSKTFSVSGNTPQLYLELFSGNNSENRTFYILLFCDGELLQAFEGEYSMFVDCEGSSLALEYPINNNLKNGVHKYQVMAVQNQMSSDVVEDHVNWITNKFTIDKK